MLVFYLERKDFVNYIKYADIGLLPFPKQAVAGGARNKALDFFASKKLVVSTPEGLRGLEEFCNQKHLIVTGFSTGEVADAILDATSNMEKYQPLTEAAYTLIKEKYSWSARARAVAEILEATRDKFNIAK